MYLMKLKDGGRGKAIVWDTDSLGDNWEIEKQLILSKTAEEIEIDGNKIKVYTSPMIQFCIKYDDNKLKLNVKKGEKSA